MPKAVIYTRVSTSDQVDGYSLKSQEEACRTYCLRNDMEPVRVFSDRGASAKSRNRPALLEMLDFCGTNASGLDFVVVHKIDRFARNVLDHQTMRLALRGMGIVLRSVSESIDETASGELIETVMAAVAQFDNQLRADRTRSGMREGALEGRWMWRPPIGYIKGPGGHPSLIPDPESHHFVAMAFEEVALGADSKSAVLDRLTALGFQRNGKPLSAQAFGTMLRNPLYMGRVVSPSLEVDAEGDFEPLVASELFANVQRTLSGKGSAERGRSLNHPDFPLRRHVRCALCDTPMTGSWSKGRTKRYGYYRCRRNCGSGSIPRLRMEEDFAAHLAQLTARAPVHRLLSEVVRDLWEHEARTSRRRADARARRRETLETQRQQLLEAFLYEKAIPSSTFEREKRRLDAELANTDEPNPTETDLNGEQLDRAFEYSQQLLTNLSGFWNQPEPQDTNAFFAAVFPDGLAYDNGFVGTGSNRWFYYEQSLPDTVEEALVAPTGFEPALPPCQNEEGERHDALSRG